jgi:hypothetical protein
MTTRKIVRVAGPALALLLALGALIYSQHAGRGGARVTSLGVHADELRAAFNRDADKVRLILLIDPT